MIQVRETLQAICEQMEEDGADYADVRYERATQTNMEVKDRKVEEVSSGDQKGIGFRAFFNGAWGFASTNDPDALDEAAKSAVMSARALSRNSDIEPFDLEPRDPVEETVGSRASLSPGIMRPEQKLAVLEDAERTMRFHSDTIRSARVVYSDFEGRYMFANSEGTFIEKEPTHYSLYCYATAKSAGNVETYMERSASIAGLEHFQQADPIAMGRKAAEMAEKIVDAPRAPQGRMPVVIGDRLGGLFAHEAVGHAAESDTIQEGDSIFGGRRGDEIASGQVTVIDDPTLEDKHGSYAYDDEGVPAERTTVIDEGELAGFLHSRATASRDGVRSTGNGRAQSFSKRPVVRMSNTFFDSGDGSKEEMIESIDDGLYLKGFKGGQVDTSEGNFTFGTTHAYRIEDGELGEIVRGPSLSGMTLDVLRNISMVAGDRTIGDPGYCGKNGQTVYVDTGSPHMKVDEMVIG